MSGVATVVARGNDLESLAYFGNLDSLPWALDDPVWNEATVYALSGSMDASASMALDFTTSLDLLRGELAAAACMRLAPRFSGHEWTTRGM